MNEEISIWKKAGVAFLCFESDCRRIIPIEIYNDMQGFLNAIARRSTYVRQKNSRSISENMCCECESNFSTKYSVKILRKKSVLLGIVRTSPPPHLLSVESSCAI
jgi:hypothetical protein